MQNEKSHNKITNFLKPTKVTWTVFVLMFLFMLVFGIFIILDYPTPAPIQMDVVSQPPLHIIIFSIILGILNLPLATLYSAVPIYEFSVGALQVLQTIIIVLSLGMYWYLLGSFISWLWYKFKPNAHTQKSPADG